MCVIQIAKDVRPTEDMIEKAWKRNDDGGGIAWREKDPKTGEIFVHWKKGIDTVEEMYDLMTRLPMPYVAHFRIASSGGNSFPFTHPFPVDSNVSMALSGRTNGYVLFHNGDWKGWDEMMLKTAAGFGVRIPRGRFNDTRALAWLTYVIGEGFMEALPSQRGVLFGPSDYEVYIGNGWSKINEVWCSNNFFWDEPKKHQTQGNSNTEFTRLGPWCAYSSCNRKDLVKDSKFCSAHHPTPRIVVPGTSEVAQNAPFRQGAPIPLISLELAFKLCPKEGERKISKNLYKRIVGCHERIKGENQKQKDRAIKELMIITDEVLKRVYPNKNSSFLQHA